MSSPSFNASLYRTIITPYRTEMACTLKGEILDCAGGSGEYLPFLNGEVTSLDISYPILSPLKNDKKVNADAVKLPFTSNAFDNVWNCGAAQYMDLNAFVLEAKRVTRPGGKILILVPNKNSTWDRIKKLAGLKSWEDQEGILRHYSLEDLKPHGNVKGEIQFLPFERLFRHFPQLGHTLMLEINV